MPVSCSHPAAGGSRPSLVLHSSLLGQRGKVFQGQFGGKREKAAAAAAVLAPRSFQQPPTTSDCGRSTSPFHVVGNWKKSRRFGSHYYFPKPQRESETIRIFVFHSGIINDLDVASSSNIIRVVILAW